MSDSPFQAQSESGRRVPGPAPVTPVTPSSPARPSSREDGLSSSARAATEPRRAVAITYDPDHADAPIVTAAGQGLVAEEIIRRAREAGVPVTDDPRLAAVLSQLDVGNMIPPELYAVVAEVLAYLYRLEERVNQPRRLPRGTTRNRVSYSGNPDALDAVPGS